MKLISDNVLANILLVHWNQEDTLSLIYDWKTANSRTNTKDGHGIYIKEQRVS
jgi:hypothetical protein